MASVKESCKVTREEFLSYFDHIVELLTGPAAYESDERLKDVFVRAAKLLRYNVPNGKLNRGIAVVETYKLLVSCETIQGDVSVNQEGSFKFLREAFILGWALEILQAFFLIADDIMDKSETRRGQVCWYKLEDVGLDAINDAFFLERLVFRLIKFECSSLPCYGEVVEMLQETIFKTTIGQTMDLVTAPVGKPNLDKFSEERYMTIITYKTCYYTIYLPIAFAAALSGNSGKQLRDDIEQVAIPLGQFFQIQDDFLDLYGDPAVTGKIGTDIEDNKCSWLIVQALKMCSPDERKTLSDNYGFPDTHKIEKVKEVFDRLKLSSLYREYEDKSYNDIKSKISSIQNDGLKTAFSLLTSKLYKRDK